jgi:hypothetical protein
MLAQFQSRYPNGSLTSELVTIDHGKYIVRALVQIEGVIRATGLAAADTIEQAEDRARNRAIEVLVLTQPESALQELAQKPPSINESLKVPLTYSSQLLTSAPTANISTDTSWLDETPQPSEPVAVAVSKESGQEWQPNFSNVETLDSTNELGGEYSKVTLISSRRPIPEAIALQVETTDNQLASPIENLTETNPPFDRQITNKLIEIEMKRLGWTPSEGKEYLAQTYNKRSRQGLSDEQLLEFLRYLEAQPDPIE